MDCRLSCELIVQAYAEQAPSSSARARLYLCIREAIIARRLTPGTALPATAPWRRSSHWGGTPWCGCTTSSSSKATWTAGWARAPSSPTRWPLLHRSQKPRRMVGARSEGLSKRGCRIAADALSSRVQAGAFMPGFPDVTHFPFATWRKLVAKQMRLEQRHLAQYGYGGYGPLKLVLAEYLRVTRMMSCSPQQIPDPERLAPGARPVRAHARRRRRRGVDGGSGLLGGAQRAGGLRSRHPPVPVDAQGINPQEADWDHPPRLIFVSPSSQYPTRCGDVARTPAAPARVRGEEFASGSSRTTTTTRSATTTTRWPRFSACLRLSG